MVSTATRSRTHHGHLGVGVWGEGWREAEVGPAYRQDSDDLAGAMFRRRILRSRTLDCRVSTSGGWASPAAGRETLGSWWSGDL